MFKNNINLNLYKTFYDVARFRSFSKAAEFTYTTQPAISKAIKKLESELETELFIRKSDGVELTEKGKELLYYVEKSFGNLLTAERIMLESENLNRGKLSVGMPSNIYTYFMIDKILDFNKNYPKIEITVITGTTSYLLNQLELHKIDFIIDTLPIITLNNDLTITNLGNINYCFIAPNKDEYKNIKSIKDLNNYNLLLPIPGTNNRSDLDDLLIKNEVELNNVTNLHTSEMILLSTMKNMGIGYIMENGIKEELNNGSIIKLNIKEKLPTAGVAIIYDKRFLTNVPKQFIDMYIEDMN